MKHLKTTTVYLKSGYIITIQTLGKKMSHIEITDSRVYPDEDERSNEIWRRHGLLILINDYNKVKELIKAFEL